jgi:nucleoside-triphosphatase THEP1
MTRKKKIILDLNTQFARALELMEKTTQNVFVTGRAGTGKSTLLSHFRDTTKKNVVVLAPTGVAAVNIAGQTIHSFFHFKPDTTVQKVRRTKIAEADVATYQRLETIVIDEISMVRADLLDCIDVFLRDLHRCLAPGGMIKIRVPHFTSRHNFIDPTHKKMFSIETFDFFVRHHGTHEDRAYYFDFSFASCARSRIVFGSIYLLYLWAVWGL